MHLQNINRKYIKACEEQIEVSKLYFEKKLGAPAISIYHAKEASINYLLMYSAFLGYLLEVKRDETDYDNAIDSLLILDKSFSLILEEAKQISFFNNDYLYPNKLKELTDDDATNAINIAEKIQSYIIKKLLQTKST